MKTVKLPSWDLHTPDPYSVRHVVFWSYESENDNTYSLLGVARISMPLSISITGRDGKNKEFFEMTVTSQSNGFGMCSNEIVMHKEICSILSNFQERKKKDIFGK